MNCNERTILMQFLLAMIMMMFIQGLDPITYYKLERLIKTLKILQKGL